MLNRLSLALALLVNYGAFAQSYTPPVDPKIMMKTITPLAPDVASLGKYIMSPPSLSNGACQQNIPLLEIKENGLSYPISLFYNYTGFKLKEEASSVGLGWGITEGMIIRVVKHLPDEHPNLVKKYEDFGSNFTEEEGTGYVDLSTYHCSSPDQARIHNFTANRIYYKLYDAQPDLYIYNFGDYSGKFLWVNGQAIQLEHNDILIEREQNGIQYTFILTAPDGVQYRFTEGDRASVTPPQNVKPSLCDVNDELVTYSSADYTTTWRLAEIKNKTTQAKITFHYSSNVTQQAKDIEQITSLTFLGPQNPMGVFFTTDFQKEETYVRNITTNYFVDEITSDNYKVSFITQPRSDGGQHRLDEIKVYNKLNLAQPVKTVKFTQGYFGDTSTPRSCWLKLKKVNIDGGGDNLLYQFSYVDEAYVGVGRLNKEGCSVDHWGYFNNYANTTLVPYSEDVRSYIENNSSLSPSIISWANRSYEFTYAKIFGLETIQYPTKGYTKINYEAANGKGVRVASLEDFEAGKSTYRYYNYNGGYPTDPNFIWVPVYDKQSYVISPCWGSLYTHPPSLVTTFNSYAKNSFDFIEDDEIFYAHVIEYMGTPDGKSGRSEYKFQKLYGYSNKVLLTSKTDFEYGNTNAINKEESYYNYVAVKSINFWRIPELVGLGTYTGGDTPGCCPSDPLEINSRHYLLGSFTDSGVNSVNATWISIDSTVTVRDNVRYCKKLEYKGVETVTGLPRHTNPITTSEKQSDGKIKRVELYYPGETDPDNSGNILGIPQMWDHTNGNFKYYTNPVVKIKTFMDNNLLSVETSQYSYDAVNDYVLRTGYEALPDGTQAGKVNWAFSYNNKANLVKIAKENDVATSVFWGYNNTLPIVKAENVEPATLSAAVLSAASNPEQLLADIGDMTTDTQKNLWRAFNAQLRSNLPAKTIFTTFTHKPLVGMTSQTDPSGIAAYYLYDEYGRLKAIKDDEGNIVKTYSYYYKQ